MRVFCYLNQPLFSVLISVWVDKCSLSQGEVETQLLNWRFSSSQQLTFLQLVSLIQNNIQRIISIISHLSLGLFLDFWVDYSELEDMYCLSRVFSKFVKGKKNCLKFYQRFSVGLLNGVIQYFSVNAALICILNCITSASINEIIFRFRQSIQSFAIFKS